MDDSLPETLASRAGGRTFRELWNFGGVGGGYHISKSVDGSRARGGAAPSALSQPGALSCQMYQ